MLEYTTFPVSNKTGKTCKLRKFTGDDLNDVQQKVEAWYAKHPSMREDGLHIVNKHWLRWPKSCK